MTSSRPMRSDAVRNHRAILSGAIAALAAEPAATMRDIADASGIGRTTLYRHFPDRDALVAAIYERVHAEADDTILRALESAPGADPVALVAGLAAELAGFGDRYRFLERHSEAAPRRGRTPVTDGGAQLLGFIAARQEDGLIRGDLAADWLLEMTAAIITRAASRHDDAPDARRSAVVRTVSSLLAPTPTPTPTAD